MDRAVVLQEISTQVAKCQACALHFSRKNAVPGEGSPTAELMFIGEGPGFYENEQGRPFVGQAGKFLDELLADAGFQREEVFIANVVKCRPPGNRDPLPDELTACSRFLDWQIETINPCVIVTLGRISMGKFLPNARISEIHGKPIWVHERLIVPMYHPAAALHQPTLKPAVIADFKALPAAILNARAAARVATIQAAVKSEEKSEADNPEQLSLF
ncbi:MAG: uracil-DNA glycosylase [Anaerolineaceae bacterium]